MFCDPQPLNELLAFLSLQERSWNRARPDNAPEVGAVIETEALLSILVVAQLLLALLVVRTIVVPLVAVSVALAAMASMPASMMNVPAPRVSEELPSSVTPPQNT